MTKISVLGAGAWGTALATVLAENGHEVQLWCHEDDVAHDIATHHINTRYLPAIALSPLIKPITSLQQALQRAEYVFEAVPVKFLRSVLEQAKPFFNDQQIWVVTSKGIEKDTSMLPAQIVVDVVGSIEYVVLAGPSFARDLAKKQYTSVMLAGNNHKAILEVSRLLHNHYFNTQFTDDVIGVQLCAALKNVIALGIGMLDGAGYTDNTKVLFLLRGLRELSEVVHFFGGKPQTVYELAGVGDVVLTAMGSLSRNVVVGRELGKGKSLDVILQETGLVPEGVNTASAFCQLMQDEKLKIPFFDGIYRIMLGHATVAQVLQDIR